jgi:serine/threonine protein kinase
MVDQSNDQHRLQFFERQRDVAGRDQWVIKQINNGPTRSGAAAPAQPQGQPAPRQVVVPSQDPIASLTEVIKAETHRKKKYPPSETGNSQRNYDLFVDLIHRMLAYDPRQRIKAEDALNHPFILAGEQPPPGQPQNPSQAPPFTVGHTPSQLRR